MEAHSPTQAAFHASGIIHRGVQEKTSLLNCPFCDTEEVKNLKFTILVIFMMQYSRLRTVYEIMIIIIIRSDMGEKRSKTF